MRKIFNLLFLALAVCLVCVPGHAEQAEKHEGKATATLFIRASSNPSLTGTIISKAVDEKNDALFLRVKQSDGSIKDYLLDKKCDETCQKAINACKGGEQCSIRGKVDETTPSITPEFVRFGAGTAPIAETKTSKKADGAVVTWTRVSPEELKRQGVKDVDACVGGKNEHGAWAEPDYKNEKGTLVKGKIWCGAISPKTMSHKGAKSYCEDKGMELGSGYPEDQNGKNNFPNEDSDWVRFRKNSGAESVKGYETPKSYTSNVLPNMNTYFWSSSVHPDYSYVAYFFIGRYGYIALDYRVSVDYVSVRCVVARR